MRFFKNNAKADTEIQMLFVCLPTSYKGVRVHCRKELRAVSLRAHYTCGVRAYSMGAG